MHIDKYKTEDGYEAKNGCFHETPEDFILSGMFGFCGCGRSQKVLKHIYQSLKLVSELQELVWEKKITYEQWEEKTKEVFLNGGDEYFMWYVLDQKGLTDHGGSVPGWLTKEGKELLSDLEEIIKI